MTTQLNSENSNQLQKLQYQVKAIAGKTLAEIAIEHKISVPENLLQNKGWVGQLIETALGVKNNSRPEPDFPELGIELKTLPIKRNGQPKESTYICVAPLTDLSNLKFEDSVVGHKLAHVLWIPIQADKNIPLAQRKIGQGLFWQPDDKQLSILVKDFQEITDQIALGRVEEITAHQGEAIQLRPKAANSKILTEATGPEGEKIMTLPRGFYLRPSFTQQILKGYL